ncbi:MAG TPA: DUF3617 family protein [Thermoanaerobaculia bacterium]|nr:DUF3617 family protein [Thermoanaerobaculia bacterium]
MRSPFDRFRLPGFSGAALSALSVLLAAAPALAIDFPTRKDGIWETTMTMDGGAPMVQKMCFTSEVEKKVQAVKAASCSRYEVRKERAAWIVESTCSVLGKVISGRTVTTGDFTSRIRADVVSTYPDGTKSTMTLDARWLRPCGPNDEPGSIVR